MQANTFNKSAGFTVIEMVVVIPIAIVVGAFLAYLFYFQYWIFNTQSAELSITNDARRALDTIDDYVRQASRVAVSYSSYNTGAQTLVLQIQSIDGSGQIITGTYDNVVFYLSGTDLYAQVFPDATSSRPASTKKLASDVDPANFGFTYDNASYPLVTQVTTVVAIRASAPSLLANSQTRSITLSSQATLRNH